MIFQGKEQTKIFVIVHHPVFLMSLASVDSNKLGAGSKILSSRLRGVVYFLNF